MNNEVNEVLDSKPKPEITVIDKLNGKVDFDFEQDYYRLLQLTKLTLHSLSEPALIKRFANGNVAEEIWYNDGVIFRAGSKIESDKRINPCHTAYWPTGEILYKEFIEEKDDDYWSTFVKYYKSGKVQEIRKAKNHKTHGIGAVQVFDTDENLIESHDYFKGLPTTTGGKND